MRDYYIFGREVGGLKLTQQHNGLIHIEVTNAQKAIYTKEQLLKELSELIEHIRKYGKD